MKILQVCSHYFPSVGGLEVHVRNISERLAGEHDVTVCTLRHGDSPRYEEEGRLKVHWLEGFFQRIPFIYKDSAMRYHPPVQDRLLIRQLSSIIAAQPR